MRFSISGVSRQKEIRTGVIGLAAVLLLSGCTWCNTKPDQTTHADSKVNTSSKTNPDSDVAIDALEGWNNFQQKMGNYLVEQIKQGDTSTQYLVTPMIGKPNFPIGSITTPRMNAMGLIDDKSCLMAPPPPKYDFSSLNIEYDLDKNAAFNIGFDKAISFLASFKAGYTDSATYSISLTESQLQVASKSAISSDLLGPICKRREHDPDEMMVVGYIAAKQVYSIKFKDDINATSDIRELVNVGFNYNKGTESWERTDTMPTSVVAILSHVSGKPLTASSTQVEEGIKRRGVFIQADSADMSGNGAKIINSLLNSTFEKDFSLPINTSVDLKPSTDVPKAPHVKYFRAADAASAAAVAKVVKALYPSFKGAELATSIYPTNPGLIEVWLPQVRAATPATHVGP